MWQFNVFKLASPHVQQLGATILPRKIPGWWDGSHSSCVELISKLWQFEVFKLVSQFPHVVQHQETTLAIQPEEDPRVMGWYIVAQAVLS